MVIWRSLCADKGKPKGQKKKKKKKKNLLQGPAWMCVCVLCCAREEKKR
jgi:hypothetical protein